MQACHMQFSLVSRPLVQTPVCRPARTHRKHTTCCPAAQQPPEELNPALQQPELPQLGRWRPEQVPTPQLVQRQAARTGFSRAWRAIPWAALGEFFLECGRVVRRLSAPSLGDAVNRLGLILATSLVMIVVVTSIDSSCLWLYVAGARRLA